MSLHFEKMAKSLAFIEPVAHKNYLEQCRQIGMIIKHDHFTTSNELKTMLETKYPGLDVSERTIRRNPNRLGFTSTLPRKVPVLTN
jgi:hypothetical protein